MQKTGLRPRAAPAASLPLPAPLAAPLPWRDAAIRIRRLGPAERGLLAQHLLALPPADLRARFGAVRDPAMIARDCARLDLAADLAVGGFDAAGMLVGLALGCRCGPRSVEIAVSVLPAERRRGLGAALVAAVCGAARQQGATEAVVEGDADNRPMRALLLHPGVRPPPGEGAARLPLRQDR